MLAALKRHPLPVSAFFRHSLVLTYAFPRAMLEPLLPPGLTVDAWKDWGFVAIALVQTERLRPTFLPPAFGQRFFLSGYRIFARFTTNKGQRLRGLRILRSDTDNRLMAVSGNMLTHYNYKKARVTLTASDAALDIDIRTRAAEADLHVTANLTSAPALPPAGSPFPDLKTARQFAGPLPFTFDYERETHSIIVIEGVRQHWDPKPVDVQVHECTFFEQPHFQGTTPVLANAFYIRDIPYQWRPGRREALPEGTR